MLDKPKISIIIPTYNEAENIEKTIHQIFCATNAELVEVIIVDSPESNDNAEKMLENDKVVFVKSNRKGRAFQMNFGAKLAKSEILYFVHADTLVHKEFVTDILESLNNGFGIGCYRYIFDSGNYLLKINAFFTRFPFIWCRGGDQTLFISKINFDKIGGFREDFLIMEDYDFILRAKKKLRFRIIPKNIIVSARKYQENSYLKVQWANFVVMRMFLGGKYSQKQMVEKYKNLIRHR